MSAVDELREAGWSPRAKYVKSFSSAAVTIVVEFAPSTEEAKEKGHFQVNLERDLHPRGGGVTNADVEEAAETAMEEIGVARG